MTSRVGAFKDFRGPRRASLLCAFVKKRPNGNGRKHPRGIRRTLGSNQNAARRKRAPVPARTDLRSSPRLPAPLLADTQAMYEMRHSHVLVLFLFCVSTNAFSTYLVEEKSEVCFYRFAEEKATLKAKVRSATYSSLAREGAPPTYGTIDIAVVCSSMTSKDQSIAGLLSLSRCLFSKEERRWTSDFRWVKLRRRELANQLGRCTLGHTLGWWAAARMFLYKRRRSPAAEVLYFFLGPRACGACSLVQATIFRRQTTRHNTGLAAYSIVFSVREACVTLWSRRVRV